MSLLEIIRKNAGLAGARVAQALYPYASAPAAPQQQWKPTNPMQRVALGRPAPAAAQQQAPQQPQKALFPAQENLITQRQQQRDVAAAQPNGLNGVVPAGMPQNSQKYGGPTATTPTAPAANPNQQNENNAKLLQTLFQLALPTLKRGLQAAAPVVAPGGVLGPGRDANSAQNPALGKESDAFHANLEGQKQQAHQNRLNTMQAETAGIVQDTNDIQAKRGLLDAMRSKQGLLLNPANPAVTPQQVKDVGGNARYDGAVPTGFELVGSNLRRIAPTPTTIEGADLAKAQNKMLEAEAAMDKLAPPAPAAAPAAVPATNQGTAGATNLKPVQTPAPSLGQAITTALTGAPATQPAAVTQPAQTAPATAPAQPTGPRRLFDAASSAEFKAANPGAINSRETSVFKAATDRIANDPNYKAGYQKASEDRGQFQTRMTDIENAAKSRSPASGAIKKPGDTVDGQVQMRQEREDAQAGRVSPKDASLIAHRMALTEEKLRDANRPTFNKANAGVYGARLDGINAQLKNIEAAIAKTDDTSTGRPTDRATRRTELEAQRKDLMTKHEQTVSMWAKADGVDLGEEAKPADAGGTKPRPAGYDQAFEYQGKRYWMNKDRTSAVDEDGNQHTFGE